MKPPRELYIILALTNFTPKAEALLNRFASIQIAEIERTKGLPIKANWHRSLLFLFSKIISERRGHKMVEELDVETAVILHHYLVTRPQIARMVEEGRLGFFKQQVRTLNEFYQSLVGTSIGPQELDRLAEIKGNMFRFISEIEEMPLDKVSEIVSSIEDTIMMLMYTLVSNEEKWSVEIEDINRAYRLFRMIAFRTPLLDFDTLYDLYRLLQTNIYVRMEQLEITSESEERLQEIVESEMGIKEDKNLQKVGSKWKDILKGCILSIAQIYVVKKSRLRIDNRHADYAVGAYHKIASKIIEGFDDKEKESLYEFIRNLNFSLESENALAGYRRWLLSAISAAAGSGAIFKYSSFVFKQSRMVALFAAIMAYKNKHDVVTIDDVKKATQVYAHVLLDLDFDTLV
ncbi:MAG: hypothetical protein ACFE7E_03360 [Candidatus Hodarchaeota archaeon]